MCGIAGICDFRAHSTREHLDKMTALIAHRGPDDSGFEWRRAGSAEIGFGHRRLSIIDLSPAGHQPMISSCGNYIIIYNGELYNYKEVMKELQQEGVDFHTSSDTEVVLNAFIKWGVKAMQHFNGMFAFSILDLKNEKVTLVRDRVGVKPLYYHWNSELFLFASEIKAFYGHPDFKKKIDLNSLGLYLQYGYISAPFSIYQDTFKVKPGHLVEIDLKSKKIREEKYWDINDHYDKPRLRISVEDATEELERLFVSAFNYRMVSDVPVGIFLSGGYDSTAVAAILQKDKSRPISTFTIGFHEKEWDEAGYARQIAKSLGTEHHEKYCSHGETIALLSSIPEILDEPLADQSVIPTFMLSKLAREHVKVALSADGGDELFAGYNRYHSVLKHFTHWKTKKYGSPALLKLLSAPAAMLLPQHSTRLQLLESVLNNSIQRYASIATRYFGDKEVYKMISRLPDLAGSNQDPDTLRRKGTDDLNDMLALDFRNYLVDDCLMKVDRCTMAVGLEGREPLLDHRISEFAAQLPGSYKNPGNSSKFMLKQIVHKYIPKELMDRPKMGFSIPLSQWLLHELKPLLDEYTSVQELKREGIFDPVQVTTLKEAFLRTGDHALGQKIWNIILFRMWNKKWNGAS